LLCQTGFHFQGKQTRDVSKGKCYHSLLYPERGFKVQRKNPLGERTEQNHGKIGQGSVG
jgi:hypothetical protein